MVESSSKIFLENVVIKHLDMATHEDINVDPS